MLKLARKELVQLSPKARQRLKWIEGTWSMTRMCLTARHFAISQGDLPLVAPVRPQEPGHTGGPAEQAQALYALPTWTTAQVLAVKALRERFPALGKLKLAVLLLRQGSPSPPRWWAASCVTSKRTASWREPPLNRTPAQRRRWQRPYATRKPKEHLALHPGTWASTPRPA
ncbi:MAG: hypothetical protein HS107_06295 [Thermoflexaceae bacterium]|nr:hypothetical protein [Thermoflexaceae bacterium]